MSEGEAICPTPWTSVRTVSLTCRREKTSEPGGGQTANYIMHIHFNDDLLQVTGVSVIFSSNEPVFSSFVHT